MQSLLDADSLLGAVIGKSPDLQAQLDFRIGYLTWKMEINERLSREQLEKLAVDSGVPAPEIPSPPVASATSTQVLFYSLHLFFVLLAILFSCAYRVIAVAFYLESSDCWYDGLDVQ